MVFDVDCICVKNQKVSYFPFFTHVYASYIDYLMLFGFFHLNLTLFVFNVFLIGKTHSNFKDVNQVSVNISKKEIYFQLFFVNLTTDL